MTRFMACSERGSRRSSGLHVQAEEPHRHPVLARLSVHTSRRRLRFRIVSSHPACRWTTSPNCAIPVFRLPMTQPTSQLLSSKSRIRTPYGCTAGRPTTVNRVWSSLSTQATSSPPSSRMLSATTPTRRRRTLPPPQPLRTTLVLRPRREPLRKASSL